jgi:hypothetical protein
MAQSPATDDLGAYFRVAAQIAESLSEEDRIGIHTAGVRMTGGHLRSQTRYYSMKKAVPVDETSVVLMTRTSNALDFALLIQELVPLLDAYEHALNGADDRKRLELADAICQGVSADPELFLNRVELLGAYSMIEPLFIATDGDEHAAYTAMGQRHVQLIHKYEERLNRLARPLSEDCSHFRPTDGAYSPYGVVYGFSSHLIEHMALKASQPDAVRHFSLEDVFVGGGADKLAWVNGWRKLPHLTLEVQARFEYPHQFALEMFERVENAFHRRVSGAQSNAIQTGRLFVVSADAPHLDSHTTIEALPSRFIESSDRELVAARKAEYCDEARLLSDRQEGRSLLSYQTSGGRVSITKSILTEVLGAGRDVKVDLPPAAARVLKLMSPRLVTCVASP